MFPVRLSMVTYNLWANHRWPERRAALGQFVELFNPDILCIQEYSQELQAFLDEAMAGHSRVHDELPGWTCEGNIYWNSELLEPIEHGAEDIGIIEQHRRLFWVRLRVRESGRSIFVGTAHFTTQLNEHELTSGVSPRHGYTRRTISVLERLVHSGEPAFFMGDLNDPILPTRLLHEAGYVSCFSALGLQSPPTWRCYPTANVSAGAPAITQTVDWVVSNQHARAIAAQVPKCFHGDMAPSDHWPVQAVYEI